MARLRPTLPDGRLGNQQSAVDPSRLQIRVVPYSPPRISSDGSTPSRPVSYVEVSPKRPPLASCQDRENQPKNDTGGSLCLLEVESQLQDSTGPDPLMDLTNETAESADHVNKVENWSIVSPTTIPASPSPSYRPSRRTIAVNSDKTFSLLPQSCSSASAVEGLRSPRRSSTAPSSSADRTISGTFGDDQPSSPLTPPQELSRSPCSSFSSPFPANFIAASSPSNYTLVGGVRKVPDSDGGGKAKALSIPSLPVERDLQAAFVGSRPSASGYTQPGTLSSKQSFPSESASTLSERSNYKTFVSESPYSGPDRHFEAADDSNAKLSLLSSSHSNFQIIGETCSEQSAENRSSSDTNDSNRNYVLHGDFPSSPPTAVASGSVLKTEYSRESLVVAPLRPSKRFFSDQATVSHQKSRDSIRTGSLTSISSAFVEEAARSLFAGGSVITSHGGGIRHTSPRRNTTIGPGNRHQNLSYHHHWSATLSPILSESDRGSAVPSLAFSHTTAGDRRLQSQSFDVGTPDLPRNDGQPNVEAWMELPPPASHRVWNRDLNNSSLRLIRDQDEHGDGLAELEELQRRPSRTRLHSYLSSLPSDRNLRSSGSSRSNSFSRCHIPAWARLYYGSGERRFLTIQHSSDSLFSEFSASVHNSPLISRSPSIKRFTPGTQLPPQRRPPPAPCEAPSAPQSASDGPVSCPPLNMVCRIKKQTSSIWSPHLRRDRRSRRYNLWRPPSTVWIKEEHISRRSNIQAIMFVSGFVFPFAWMIASFLPLPPTVEADMKEKNHSTSHMDLEQGRSGSNLEQDSDNCYNKVEWWRSLNRYMSIIGLLLVGAAIALIVTSTQQRKP
ncbi:serine-rich protein [Metarhizium guizhouense ARSEF 977]|uniref:Serine-rich protein n=1 Tax=Metarhizium guizhouense (strain ARSEF 977) TaxID=1276136 RepID=A0A0B4GQU6_METGA|nr:serine-rich protein [Metarhizium guizhouense ARSEF 977]